MAEHRHHEHRCGPVQTSAVYLVGRQAHLVERPPSPPSPAALQFCSPIDQELPDLDTVAGPEAGLQSPLPLPPPPPLEAAAAAAAAAALLQPASPTVTAPPSPSLRPDEHVDVKASIGGQDIGQEGDGMPPSPPSPLDMQLAAPAPTAEDISPQLSSVGNRLADAVSVLNAEAAALASLAHIYSTDVAARAAFDEAVSVITQSQRRQPTGRAPDGGGGGGGGGGTLVVCGVGKSGHIARKLAATFSSLSVRAAFMHPTEALHGDLGLLAPGRDAVVLVSFSGRTPELLALVPHLHPALPVVVITAARDARCEIAALLRKMRRQQLGSLRRMSTSRSKSKTQTMPIGCPGSMSVEDAVRGRWEQVIEGSDGGLDEAQRHDEQAAPVVVLPAPIPVSEVDCLGIAAPTASTTAALALGDALAVVAGRELHGGTTGMAAAFTRNHPGGAIGAAASAGPLGWPVSPG